MSSWSKRNLSVLGRVVVVKSLVLPKLSYIAQMLPNPSSEFIKTLNKDIYDFIWKGKPDRIKRCFFSQSYENGGVKMPNVEMHINSLKINWIRRVASGNQKWIQLFYLCAKLKGADIFCFGINRLDKMKHTLKNHFWYDTLHAWSTFLNVSNNQNMDFNRIAKQYLWCMERQNKNWRSICKLYSLKGRGGVFCK